MGLDISVKGNLKFVETETEENEDRFNDLDYLYCNPSFPGRNDGLQDGLYECDNLFSFRAGSYSEYGEWRNELSLTMLGVPAREVWENPAFYKDKPFYELINFSDCEGVIGSKTSAKLAKDFQDHVSKLQKPVDKQDEELGVGYFNERYHNWMKAFELASSNNGCVRFS